MADRGGYDVSAHPVPRDLQGRFDALGKQEGERSVPETCVRGTTAALPITWMQTSRRVRKRRNPAKTAGPIALSATREAGIHRKCRPGGRTRFPQRGTGRDATVRLPTLKPRSHLTQREAVLPKAALGVLAVPPEWRRTRNKYSLHCGGDPPQRRQPFMKKDR